MTISSSPTGLNVSQKLLVRDLYAAVADLGAAPSRLERLRSSLRLGLLAAVLLSCSWLYWVLLLSWQAIGAVLLAGVAYALVLIATHEMVHGNFLGHPKFEQLLGCILSWPMAWPYLTYSRLHRLHHRWNGTDLRDPERTTPISQELEMSGRWQRFLRRHPLLVRMLIIGGVGLIAKTAIKGRQLQAVDRSLRRACIIDGVGVFVLHSVLLLLVISHGVLLRYLLFWLLLERMIGMILQFRGLVEHHGLFLGQGVHLLTQLYASRSITAGPWLNALMGGLPYHGAHHAFPWIPAARLPQATQRIASVLSSHNADKMPQVPSYGDAMVLLWRKPTLPRSMA